MKVLHQPLQKVQENNGNLDRKLKEG